MSIEFRNAPEAPYPASLQDINYGIRWLKAHAREFGSSPERVGPFAGYVERRTPGPAGGNAPRGSALHGPAARGSATDGCEGRVRACRAAGVLFPLERYKLAKAQGKMDIAKSHDTFFRDEQERGSKRRLPSRSSAAKRFFCRPLSFIRARLTNGLRSELAQRFATTYRNAGGTIDLQLLQGEHHTFVNEHPFAPNSVKAVEMAKAFHQEIRLGENVVELNPSPLGHARPNAGSGKTGPAADLTAKMRPSHLACRRRRQHQARLSWDSIYVSGYGQRNPTDASAARPARCYQPPRLSSSGSVVAPYGRAMRKLILRNFQSPGDIVMLTAAVRDIHRAHPGEFLTDVRTSCPRTLGT